MIERTADMLRVLAHPDRLQIVAYLMQQAVPVGELAEALGLRPAAVSQHLTNMRTSGIVERQRVGRHVHYRVVNPSAVALIECLRRHCASGVVAEPPANESAESGG
jgi:ArsR family transcriptional regulator